MKQETLNGKLAKLVEKYGYKAVWQTLTEIKEISPDEILSSREDIESQKQSVSNNLNENGEDSPDAIASKFASLASQWSQAVAGMSSTVEMAKHPAYREIISMGEAVIPFLLADLSQNPLYWLPALREITQENPVPPSQRGKVKQMASAWLNWGREKGYIA
ncbi:MAG: hypothetical protein GDA43_21930 [Hormoscilla sp. SP5CHS1]|nr:hypothetical protein [Hormoscilla sp. SP12CHS1]MBC6455520.1 hypothetical protein [Hormoscilla sp. SP5CHS1]